MLVQLEYRLYVKVRCVVCDRWGVVAARDPMTTWTRGSRCPPSVGTLSPATSTSTAAWTRSRGTWRTAATGSRHSRSYSASCTSVLSFILSYNTEHRWMWVVSEWIRWQCVNSRSRLLDCLSLRTDYWSIGSLLYVNTQLKYYCSKKVSRWKQLTVKISI